MMHWQTAFMWIGIFTLCGLVFWAAHAGMSSAIGEAQSGYRGARAHRIIDRRLERGEIDGLSYDRTRQVIALRNTLSNPNIKWHRSYVQFKI